MVVDEFNPFHPADELLSHLLLIPGADASPQDDAAPVSFKSKGAARERPQPSMWLADPSGFVIRPDKMMARPVWIHILRCADGSYYTGHTENLEQRLAQHQSGEGS